MSALSCEHCGGELQFGHRCRAEIDALRHELAEVKRSERSLALEWAKADRRSRIAEKALSEAADDEQVWGLLHDVFAYIHDNVEPGSAFGVLRLRYDAVKSSNR